MTQTTNTTTMDFNKFSLPSINRATNYPTSPHCKLMHKNESIQSMTSYRSSQKRPFLTAKDPSQTNLHHMTSGKASFLSKRSSVALNNVDHRPHAVEQMLLDAAF